MGPRTSLSSKPFGTALAGALVGCLALGSAGCASSGLVSAAERGDLAGLKIRIAEAKRLGKLDGGDVRDAAHATALRAVKKADKSSHFDDLRGCVRELAQSFGDRASTHDEAGARAAYLLLDEDSASPSRWSSEVASADPAWRAVGARTLITARDGTKRRELFLDLDPRVRIGAIEAAYRALDKEDAGPLLEVVRLDPDGGARNVGARTAGAIGGRDVVLGLRDRWSRADEPLRAAIASSWGFTASFDAGGHEALVWVAETQHGSPGVTAGSTLLRATKADAPVGRAALLRALTAGSSAVRVMAIHLSPMDDPELRAEIEKAAEAPDAAVKVAALGKLVLSKDKRDHALQELGTIAVSEDRAANAARVALANARDRRVIPLLVKDLSSTLPDVRAWAAGILAGMHELGEAAPALADDDPHVRGRVACAILRAPER